MPRMSRAKKSKNELRDLEITQSFLQGTTAVELAGKYGLTKQRIGQIVDGTQAKSLIRSRLEVAISVEQQLARIALVEKNAWASWYDSIKEKEEFAQEQFSGSKNKDGAMNPGRSRAFMKRYRTSGDPRFLMIILDCIEKRNKLEGLDATTRMNLNLDNRLTGMIEYRRIEEYTDEELLRLAGGVIPAPEIKVVDQGVMDVHTSASVDETVHSGGCESGGGTSQESENRPGEGSGETPTSQDELP